ncbi:MAG: hypothetical protein QF893_07110 [Alphaproteobacteria bacterium]|nr:hypothetical protein [Alphaproteobacteria bacterium]
MKRVSTIVRLRDLREALEIFVGSLVAWFVPERHWDAIVRFYVANLVKRRPPHVERRMLKVAQLFGDRYDSEGGRDIVADHDRHRQRSHLQRFKELSPFGWHPSIRVRGEAHVAAALADGNGAILWVGRFAHSDVVTKKGLHQLGLRVSHLSRPEHAFVDSWFAKRVLSPIWLVPESRYLAERIVYRKGHPTPMAKRIYQCLTENQIVSITSGPESLQRMDVPFLGCRLRIATGPANLAIMTGAPLLPVFTVRNEAGGFEVNVEPPLTVPDGADRRTSLQAMAAEFAERQGAMACKYPAQFKFYLGAVLMPHEYDH